MPRLHRLPASPVAGPLRAMTFRRQSLQAIYEQYGAVIRARNVPQQGPGTLEDYVVAKTADSMSLRRIPFKLQLDALKFLRHHKLHSFNQAISSRLVKLESFGGGSGGDLRFGDHHRDFWDQALGVDVVDGALMELLHDLNERPAVRMLMAHRPNPHWGMKPHWKFNDYYPKKAEYYIFAQALELLAEACFDFVNKWEPEYQYRRRIECAESFELTAWLQHIKEELLGGKISLDNLHGGATLRDFNRVAYQVRLLRNSTVHKGLRTAEYLSEALGHGVELTRMLGDERRTRQLESMREEVEKGSQFVEYLHSRLATDLERDIEMGILERILVVMSQRLRDFRDDYQSSIISKRSQYKNEYGIEQRENMLKIRGQIQSEPSAKKVEGEESFKEWEEQRKQNNALGASQPDAVQENQQKPPADSHPFQHAPQTSGQPCVGATRPNANIESENAPTTAEAGPVAGVSTTRGPDDVLPSSPATETTVQGKKIERQAYDYYIWKPQAVPEDLNGAKISNDQKPPHAPMPQDAKNTPSAPAVADAKEKTVPVAPTDASTAAGNSSKDVKHAPPPINDEDLDFTEVDGNQNHSSGHRLR